MSENMKAPLVPIFNLEEAFVSFQTSSNDIDQMKKEVTIEPPHEKILIGEGDANYNPLEAKSIIPWQ